LFTLLALGVKNVTIGPNPPGFVTPGVFKVLQDKFGLRVAGKDAQQDLAVALAG
jgi:hydroxylamine reductase